MHDAHALYLQTQPYSKKNMFPRPKLEILCGFLPFLIQTFIQQIALEPTMCQVLLQASGTQQ